MALAQGDVAPRGEGPRRRPAPPQRKAVSAALDGDGAPTGERKTMPEQTQTPPLRILIVDDHVIVREGLKRILGSPQEGWAVDGCSTGFEAVEWLRRRAFDLAVVDLSMPGMGGLDLIKRVRAEHPRVAILVLSMHAEEQYALRAFKAGAQGYVTKDLAATELVHAVRKVAGGGVYVTRSVAESVVLQLNGVGPGRRHDQLSDREMEVLRRLVGGQRPTDIAGALHLSVKTVSTHKTRIQDKLQLPNLAALIRYGMDQGLGVDALAPDAPRRDVAWAQTAPSAG